MITREKIVMDGKGNILPPPFRGLAIKDGVVFEIKKLKSKWKLVSKRERIKVEIVFDASDFATPEEFFSYLTENGYEVTTCGEVL